MTAYVLNVLDLLFTLHALDNGAMELNPLMQSIPAMVVYKAVAVGVLCWWLGTRRETIARNGLKVCTALFAAVDIYHIYFIIGGVFL